MAHLSLTLMWAVCFSEERGSTVCTDLLTQSLFKVWLTIVNYPLKKLLWISHFLWLFFSSRRSILGEMMHISVITVIFTNILWSLNTRFREVLHAGCRRNNNVGNNFVYSIEWTITLLNKILLVYEFIESKTALV